MGQRPLTDAEKNTIEGFLVHNLHAVVIPNLKSCDLDGLVYNAVAVLWGTGEVWKGEDPRQKRELKRLYEKWNV